MHEPISANEIPAVRRVISVSDKQSYDNSTKMEYYDIYNNLKSTVGHQLNRSNKIVKEYEKRYNENPDALTQKELERWGLYKDKLNNLKQTKDYYKLLEYKEAEKAMKQWDKEGVAYDESDVMKQVVDNVKAIDEPEQD